MVSLDSLGNKICIIGCGSSGKSSLAERLSYKKGIPVYHLDQLAFYEGSNWQRKPDNDLIEAQANILKQDKWIIDGNYSACMPERIQYASTIIWLDMNIVTSAIRFLICCVKSHSIRVGRLSGAQHEFRLNMLHHILCNYPKNRLKYKKMLENNKANIIMINNMKCLNQYYLKWEL